MLHCQIITGKDQPTHYHPWIEAVVVVSFDVDEGKRSTSQDRKCQSQSPGE